jgi:hypothetical protein
MYPIQFLTTKLGVYGKKTCQNDICLPNALGNTCGSTKDCAASLICDPVQNVCKKLVPFGSPCVVDSECGRFGKCIWGDPGENKGTCRKLYSVPNGGNVATKMKGGSIIKIRPDSNFLCESGSVNLKTGECFDGYTSSNETRYHNQL